MKFHFAESFVVLAVSDAQWGTFFVLSCQFKLLTFLFLTAFNNYILIVCSLSMFLYATCSFKFGVFFPPNSYFLVLNQCLTKFLKIELVKCWEMYPNLSQQLNDSWVRYLQAPLLIFTLKLLRY